MENSLQKKLDSFNRKAWQIRRLAILILFPLTLVFFAPAFFVLSRQARKLGNHLELHEEFCKISAMTTAEVQVLAKEDTDTGRIAKLCQNAEQYSRFCRILLAFLIAIVVLIIAGMVGLF